MPGDSNIILRVDSGTKASLHAEAKRQGLSLTRWLLNLAEKSLGTDVALTATRPAVAAGAGTPAAIPTPVPVAKEEPASRIEKRKPATQPDGLCRHNLPHCRTCRVGRFA